MTEHLALARKWRPQTFDDLIGQAHVVQTLKNAIQLERIHPAYLFSGARGTGKTSVARIFAKTLRCPNHGDARPCNRCTECVAISESRSVDVTEIDGASNNGVEQVRAIRDNVAYVASSGSYKIYIIDEVHMLSTSAFNALLKTLEEPPAHVVFIFATTEVQKIPGTIFSRCQHFDFRRLTNTQIMDRLKKVMATEKVSISEEGLRILASDSDGSLRDALSLLDQAISYHGGKGVNDLTEKQIVEALGVSDPTAVRDYLAQILKGNVSAVIKIVQESYASGIDSKYFCERCLEELRLLYLVKLAQEHQGNVSPEELDVSHEHFMALKEMSLEASMIRLERMAQILSRTLSQLTYSSLPRFVLEMAAVRMSGLETLEKIEARLLTEEHRCPSEDGKIASAEPMTPTDENASEHKKWKGFVEIVMKRRPLLGALLSHANFRIEVEGEAKLIVIAFPRGSFYEKQAMDAKNRGDIEEQLKAYFGAQTRLEFSSGVENAVASLEQKEQVRLVLLKEAALEHPAVLKAKEVLGAQIVDVQVDSPLT